MNKPKSPIEMIVERAEALKNDIAPFETAGCWKEELWAADSLIKAVQMIESLECQCKYKPLTHQYFFQCNKCKILAEIAEGQDE